jgi:hypothetical protein
MVARSALRGMKSVLTDPMLSPNGNAGSHTERRQQAMIEQLTLRIRRKEGRCRA